MSTSGPSTLDVRFSMKAVRPSARSSEDITAPNAASVIRFNVSSSCRRRGEHDGPGLPDGERSGGGDLISQLSCRVEHGAWLGESSDEPELVRPLGAHRLAGEDHLQRRTLAEHAGETEQASRTGDEVALDLGEAECRRRAGHHDVGGEGDLAATGSRQPIDGGDHRLAPLAVGEAGEATARRHLRSGIAGVDLLEVGAGTEAPAGPGRRC